jgi:predicted HTH domain antitoxin
MTVKERLHDLVERLPPSEEDTARRVLEALTLAHGVGTLHPQGPEADEPSWTLSPHGEELRVSLPPRVSAEEVRVLVAVRLFELGRISRGKAAELAGLPLREFLDVLGDSGVPLLDYEPAELAAELDG